METNHISGEGTMNTATFKAMREVGFDEKQAVVLASAIPDVERPIAELRADVRAELAHLEARIERRFTVQTWLLIGAVVTLMTYEPVFAFIQQRFPPL